MTQIVGKIKLIFGAAGKLALALFLAGVGLLTVVQIYSATADFLAEKSMEKHTVATPWTYDLSAIGIKVDGKRKYIDQSLLVSLNFVGYPEFLSHQTLSEPNEEEPRGFSLQLQDADGFDVAKLAVPLSSLSTVLGNDGKPIGLRGQYTESIDIEQYARITQVRVIWNFDTEIPEPTSQTATASSRSDSSVTEDHCAPDISRAVRLQRLAQYGEVRQTSSDQYQAGSRTVSFWADGRVIYCN
jgi:hypothetical protein